ncbi:MAG: bifunctional ADP-dependent NAD(P)H-hydrate dehydratase/NAD(P)H-hydrate epimerase, partial [Lachnospiraceae bacterium]|nr:bifunctional ADP-dependent NAD(P)H-hydrate dehydratase/NAD(P)H-hydrate epimerase [Lachnospiraceae bacterium]
MRYVADAVQMKEIDRRTSEEIGIPPIVLMEKAAEQIAQCALEMLGGQENAAGKRVLAVYGAGGNGGDAVAAARLLHLRGLSVQLLAADGKAPGGLTEMELAIAKKCGVPECGKTGNDMDFSAYDMILDGIFGIGLSRKVDGACQALIE